MKKITAHISCFHGKRKKSTIKYIVIHYTGNENDTAVNNGKFFQREQKDGRYGVGAHFFVDSNGTVIKSIPMNITAWSVGGFVTKKEGAGKYYLKCNNGNSVSIELCNATKSVTENQIKATRKLVKYIQKYCKNAKTIIRHWDVSGKECPAFMIGSENQRWMEFKENMKVPKTVKTTVEGVKIRDRPNKKYTKSKLKKGTKCKLDKIVINNEKKYGRIKKTGKWIRLKNTTWK